MTEDEPFLRALLANPDDRTTRLVYADWLDDRADPRAEYLRLSARVADLPHDNASRADLRRRMLELQAGQPPWWVAIAGGLRRTKANEYAGGPAIEGVSRALDRPAKRTDADGYGLTITAAATSGLTGAIAYLEERSKWRGEYHDIHYRLHLRDAAGRTAVWEPYTYNPYFGCETRFMEWYGDTVLFIYREKHSVYIARFGFDAPARYHRAEDYWVLDGRVFTCIGYRKREVRRISVPGLEELPPLSLAEARARDLLPDIPSWWLLDE